MKKIGFIGLGQMGMPMALNLCNAGFEVYSHSSTPEKQSRLEEAGAHPIKDFAAMASFCDVLISIVPADAEVNEIASVVIANARPGLVWIEMTSAKGITKTAIARSIAEAGKDICLLDAPVSGGVSGAEKGTLTIMVGGDRDILNQHMDVLQAMGKNIYYAGDVGSGSNVKMLNQMLNAGNTAIAAEVLCLSRQLGVDDKILSDIVNKSSGGSFVFERNVPKFMMTGNHTPGFRLDLMKKDISLYVDTARSMESFSPLGNLVYQIYGAASHQGMGNENYTAVHKWFEENQKEV